MIPNNSEVKQNYPDNSGNCQIIEKPSGICTSSTVNKPGPDKPTSYLYNIKYNNNVCSVSINSKTSLLASGFENSEIHIFSIKSLTSKESKDVDGEQNLISQQDMPPINNAEESNSLFSDGKVLNEHKGSVLGLVFSCHHPLLLSCSEDSSIHAWNTNSFDTVAVYGDTQFPVLDVITSQNGLWFATASMNATASLWDFERIQPLRTFVSQEASINKVRFHPNSKYLATASDKIIQMWAVEDGHSVRKFSGHESCISCFTFSPNQKHLASADESGLIKIWDIASEKVIGEIKAHNKGVLSMRYSKKKNLLASGGFDEVLKVWDVQNFGGKKTSSIEKLCDNEDSTDSLLLDSHSTGAAVHHVGFRNQNLLCVIATET